MKTAIRWLSMLALLTGCDLPGKPDPQSKFEAPTKITDFAKLYAKNCAGCHGKDGRLGPAPPLNDGIFLAIVPESELVKVIAGGRKGTEMPGFDLDQGGTLTKDQVKALAVGLGKKWGDASVQKKAWADYVVPTAKGDADRGKAVFARVCAACHGQDGHVDPKYGAINDSAFLALASEQALRRFVITGRADLGMPSSADQDGGALSSEEINDVVALMMAWKAQGAAK